MHSVLDCRFVVFVTHWAKPITYKGMTVSPVRNRPHRPRVLAVQEAVPRHRTLDFVVFSICDPCGPTDDIYRFCMLGQKTNESGLQATMDAVAPFKGNTMQFMQFLHLHLYSPICAFRIGGGHVFPCVALDGKSIIGSAWAFRLVTNFRPNLSSAKRRCGPVESTRFTICHDLTVHGHGGTPCAH